MTSLTGKNNWQWWDDHQWVDYDTRFSDMIDKAIRDGTMVVTFSFGSSNYEINLFTMVQKNLSTGFGRRIRCSVIVDVPIQWQWDNGGTWNDYDDSTNLQINQQSPNNVTVNINGQEYEINPENMVQTNNSTGVFRNIRQQINISSVSDPVADLKPVDMECICYARNKDTVLIPCGHMLCRTCAARVIGRGQPCPFCRRPIEKLQYIFL
jgi:hypothetical protein